MKKRGRKKKTDAQHRTKIEVTRLILDVAGDSGGVGKTKMMNRANLSHQRLKEHLKFLIGRNLIYYDIKTETFKITEKGLRFLCLCSEIENMVKNYSYQQPKISAKKFRCKVTSEKGDS